MPDITMCTNHECRDRKKCWRYTAIPNPKWQSWAEFIVPEDGKCKAFIDNKGRKNKEDGES